MSRTLTAAILAALAFAGSPALAKTENVRFNDLNLNSAAGQETMARRINQAAQRVCAIDEPTGSRIKMPREQRKCIARAQREARAQLARQAAKAKSAG